MNIQELKLNEWNEVDIPKYIGQVPFNWEELEKLLNLIFADVQEEGLLPEKVLFIGIQGHAYKLRGIKEAYQPDSNDNNSKDAIQLLAKQLGIDKDEIK